MVSKNKKKSNKILYAIVIFMVILILLTIILLVVSKSQKGPEISEGQGTQEQTEDLENQAIIAKLQGMTERERMEFYLKMFLDFIENGEYEEAYALLYPQFKEDYFSTLEEFVGYVQKTFSDFAVIEYENIERNGDVYVLWVDISDAVNGKPGEKKEMNFVIKENGFNDFVMSFSAE